MLAGFSRYKEPRGPVVRTASLASGGSGGEGRTKDTSWCKQGTIRKGCGGGKKDKIILSLCRSSTSKKGSFKRVTEISISSVFSIEVKKKEEKKKPIQRKNKDWGIQMRGH